MHVLSPVVPLIAAQRAQVLQSWRDLYALHLGEARTLSDVEFNRVMGSAIDSISGVVKRNPDAFQADVKQRWYTLAVQGVPFTEAMVIVHLFEESVITVIGPRPSKDILTCPLVHEFAHRCMPIIAEAYLQAGLKSDWQASPRPSRPKDGIFHGLVGSSAPMQRLYGQIEAVGRTASTALILGETGTGKELVARAIHECGPGADAPFIAVNCAALPGHLIESELFGHVRGAFTDADADAQGLFRAAHEGTLFLDEITEMNMAAQARLLRAIQERKIRPVGSLREIPVEVRIIASTNRDPQEAIANGHLRQDLYYRLNVAPLQVPALRERREDIEALAWHFIKMFNQELPRSVPVVGVSLQAMDAMLSYAWPGNVRELANAVESAITFGTSDTIGLDDLHGTILPRPAEPRMPAEIESIADAERELARRALEATNGNISAAARLLGITRKKLYARMVRYGLRR